jgi:hypothetical protein
MTDLLLNRDTHDLTLVNYDLNLVTGVPLVQQRLKQSLMFFLGEWFLDETDGVPYYRDILKKSPDKITVESALKTAILETPDVLELLEFNLTYDNPIRSLYVAFKVKTVFGNVNFSGEL